MSALAENLTPRSLGYFMPAEWAEHRATWLSWPHNRDTWPSQLETVRGVWAQMVAALSPHERVNLLVNDEAAEREVAARLRRAGAAMENVTLYRIPTVDVWMRDYGPTFVVRESREEPLAFNDWIFNGWGGKYKDYEKDERVAREIAARLKVPVFDHQIVLEGGSIEVNGAGICLTTEQCLLNKNRNPHLSRAEIEAFLQDSLGVEQIVWLGQGIAGDDTDGHIDDIARFVGPATVACIIEGNPKDENYHALQENYERLQGATDRRGGKLSLVTLPCPAPLYLEGARLPASYANFYIANRVVLVPVFDDPNDKKALGILREVFADREVIGLRCNEVVAGLGAIHCVTQQEPSAGAQRA
ncbi:MAG TPA: agmatine deiminase family protein [Candidatus Binatia bacterium]|nr:agmatine deiminase family protein [Candidatus Binatia bacterium]